jgi:hypothetical protein
MIYPVKHYRDANFRDTNFIERMVEITEDDLHDIGERPSRLNPAGA